MAPTSSRTPTSRIALPGRGGLLGAAVALWAALALAPLAPSEAEAQEAPAIPATYFGSSEPGAVITASIDDVECARAEAGADGLWLLQVGPGACAPGEGDIVRFSVDGRMARETVTWQSGGLLDDLGVGLVLSVEPAPPVDPPEPADAPVPEPPEPSEPEPPEEPLATFEVDSELDETDTQPGDGECSVRTGDLPDSGACTLRAAIQEANASGRPALVRLPAGDYVLVRAGAEEDEGATGDLDIAGDLQLAGAGSDSTVVDGAGLDRVLHVLSGVVTLSGLTITGGLTDSNLPGGGGVRNEADLTLRDVLVTANASLEDGGGIENAGTLALEDSIVSDNSAGDYGGGLANGERSLSPDANVVIERSTIAGNSSSAGGGGIATNGALTLRESTVSGNVDGGGAIFVGNSGVLTIENSTISGNDEVGLLVLDGRADVTSSTFAENDGTMGDAPGIVNASDTGSEAGTVVVTGSIVADGCSGAVVSGGYNIDDAGTCAFTEPTDQSEVDPQLGPLAENGGSTLTHAPLEGSAAIDAGGGTGPATDQRGVERPQAEAFDVGSVEVEQPTGVEDSAPNATPPP